MQSSIRKCKHPEGPTLQPGKPETTAAKAEKHSKGRRKTFLWLDCSQGLPVEMLFKTTQDDDGFNHRLIETLEEGGQSCSFMDLLLVLVNCLGLPTCFSKGSHGLLLGGTRKVCLSAVGWIEHAYLSTKALQELV